MLVTPFTAALLGRRTTSAPGSPMAKLFNAQLGQGSSDTLKQVMSALLTQARTMPDVRAKLSGWLAAAGAGEPPCPLCNEYKQRLSA